MKQVGYVRTATMSLVGNDPISHLATVRGLLLFHWPSWQQHYAFFFNYQFLEHPHPQT